MNQLEDLCQLYRLIDQGNHTRTNKLRTLDIRPININSTHINNKSHHGTVDPFLKSSNMVRMEMAYQCLIRMAHPR